MHKDFKNLRLFFGVEWLFCESKQILAQEIAEVKRIGRKYVTRTDGTRHWLGLLPEGEEIEAGRINLPAAVVAATQYANAVIQLDLPQDKGWICVISEGQPNAEYDRVMSRDASIKAAYEAAKIFMDSAIISDSIEGAVTDFRTICEKGVHNKAVYQGMYFKTPFFTKRRLKVMTAVCIMSALAFAGYHQYSKYRQKQFEVAQGLAAQAKKQALKADELARVEADKKMKMEAFSARLERERKIYESPNGLVLGNIFEQWKKTSQDSALHIIPNTTKGNMQCSDNNCAVTWVLKGGDMIPRYDVTALGARLSGGNASVDSVVKATSVIKDYPIIKPEFPKETRDIQYPRTPLEIKDSMAGMGTMVFPQPLQPHKVPGIPELQVPDVIIGQKQPFILNITGPFAMRKCGDAFAILQGYPVNIGSFRVEYDGLSVKSAQISGDFLLKSGK